MNKMEQTVLLKSGFFRQKLTMNYYLKCTFFRLRMLVIVT